eukprot:jgi/Ulvmu1/2629/UM014_0081.1
MAETPQDTHAVTIQKWIRGWLSRKRAARLAAASRQQKLQRRAQALQEKLQISEQERVHLEALDPAGCIEYWNKRDAASLVIQRYTRGWRVRRRPDLKKVRRKRTQAAIVIQKHARGYLVRNSACKPRSKSASRTPSPPQGLHPLDLDLVNGMINVPEEKIPELVEEALEYSRQFVSTSDDEYTTSEQLNTLLKDSDELSREIGEVLVHAAKTRASTDHLFRTWQVRHELPCDAANLDPNAFPRPPRGTGREERARLAHAHSLAEVVDLANMNDTEESWWKMYVRSVVDATVLEPDMGKERITTIANVRDAHWDVFAQTEAQRMKCWDRSDRSEQK